MSLHYSLDSIVIRGRRIFGWGFCLDTKRPLAVRSLRVPLSGGRAFDLDVHASGAREDLRIAFPQASHASSGGFLVTGALPEDVSHGTAYLIVDGLEAPLALSSFPEAFMPGTEVPVSGALARFRSVFRQRGLREALRAGLAGAGRRVSRLIGSVTARHRNFPKGAAIILDHGMGGGANRYRNQRAEALRASGVPVIVVSSALATLSYRVEAHGGSRISPSLHLEDQAALVSFVESIEPSSIEVNNLVGYEDVSVLLRELLRLKIRSSGLRLRFNLHDFHAACPSFTLIGEDGSFCGIPETVTCDLCLARNSRFTLGMNVGVDIRAWRASWKEWLLAADELVAFSQSSLRLVDRAIPGIPATAWRVEPHSLDGFGLRPIQSRLAAPLAIIAVGHLNHAKGGSLMRDLARRAEERSLPFRFSVVGTVEGGEGSTSLRITGPFERERLCDLLEAEGAGVLLLPSICPETYSYVTDELMATGLPLAVLDIGAPAERVIGYHSGLILPCNGLDDQLDALMSFARKLGAPI